MSGGVPAAPGWGVATFLVGDVFERLTEIPDGSVDLVLTSPPFLALRSYLPADHPQKDQEIGSEATPAEYIDTLLDLTAEWARVLAPHGSIAVELGDTYAGSGGSGGDYNGGGLRASQATWQGSAAVARTTLADGRRSHTPWKGERVGWPFDKSLCGIPQAYQLSLAYGRNILDPGASPSRAGRWRVRTLKPWIRSNPPVGALGDKERPATSYVIVATRTRDRYFDLDAVRTALTEPDRVQRRVKGSSRSDGWMRPENGIVQNPAGAPPRDWWHHVDAVLDAVLDEMAGKAWRPDRLGGDPHRHHSPGGQPERRKARTETASGARGVHLRRALERAGILRTVEALDVSAKGYRGAHYAVWPPELVRLLVEEMCPHRVCLTCGAPSRRITDTAQLATGRTTNGPKNVGRKHETATGYPSRTVASTTTVGWSDCGCLGDDRWRPGRVLDPFVGSGTTLAVCSGLARDAIGIDIDIRNVELARERVGMLLNVEDHS